MKRNTIIAVMITFCFAASLFMIIPIRSANSPYNPWLDYDDNGAVGLTDLVSLANSYGTTGDPTKNVNVMNWQPPQFVNAPTFVNLTWSNWGGFVYQTEGLFFSTLGYAKMSIFITPTNTSTGDWGGKSLTIQVNRLRWFSDPAPSLTKGHSEEFVEDYNTTMYHYPNSFLVTDPSDARVFDVKGPFCYLIIYPQWDLDALPPIAYPDGWISLQINWYLRTD